MQKKKVYFLQSIWFVVESLPDCNLQSNDSKPGPPFMFRCSPEYDLTWHTCLNKYNPRQNTLLFNTYRLNAASVKAIYCTPQLPCSLTMSAVHSCLLKPTSCPWGPRTLLTAEYIKTPASSGLRSPLFLNRDSQCTFAFGLAFSFWITTFGYLSWASASLSGLTLLFTFTFSACCLLFINKPFCYPYACTCV